MARIAATIHNNYLIIAVVQVLPHLITTMQAVNTSAARRRTKQSRPIVDIIDSAKNPSSWYVELHSQTANGLFAGGAPILAFDFHCSPLIKCELT